MRPLTVSEEQALEKFKRATVDEFRRGLMSDEYAMMRRSFAAGLDTAAEQVAALTAENERLRAALAKDVKHLSRLVKAWRAEASGHYCQTYNTGQAKGLNIAANMLNEYVKELERRTERQDKPPVT